jgi:hypothetical protein
MLIAAASVKSAVGIHIPAHITHDIAKCPRYGLQIMVTGNVRDFDLLNQLVPDGRILLYRKSE